LIAGPLPQADFQRLVSIAPLVSIDLVMVDSDARVLLGLRRNRPAQGFWFVPGGRIRKGETMDAAFLRISETELGFPRDRGAAELLGIYDHIYPDSSFDTDLSTHYVTIAYLLGIGSGEINAPQDQHSAYRWLSLSELLDASDVHANTKAYVDRISSLLDARSATSV
jgi:colanic acid biosynthesis protein WcaH